MVLMGNSEGRHKPRDTEDGGSEPSRYGGQESPGAGKLAIKNLGIRGSDENGCS